MQLYCWNNCCTIKRGFTVNLLHEKETTRQSPNQWTQRN